jgi:hypothetical protein
VGNSTGFFFSKKGLNMGMFKDVMEGFTNGFLSAAVDSLRNGRSQGNGSNGQALVERMCQELGWPIDERDGTTILLYFKDPILRVRKVAINTGESVIGFTVLSAATLNPRQVSAEIMAYLLLCNSKLGGSAWQMFESGNGNAGFSVAAYMLMDGMNSAMFKFLCESMAKAAHEFDAKLNSAGLL